MNFKQTIYSLLRDAYSIASIGIGVQRHSLETLIQGREVQEFEEAMFYHGLGSNFLASPIVSDALHPRRKDAEYAGFFGDKASHIRRKTKSLIQQEKEITNIVLRSILNESVTDDQRDLNVREYMGFFSIFQRDYVASDSPKREASFDSIATKLMECDNIASLDIFLSREELYPSREFYEKIVHYQKNERLRARHIRYHADKLELMIDILENLLEIARRKGVKISPKYKPYALRMYPEYWEDLLDEKVPSPKELIENSRKSVQKAREFLRAV